MNIKPLSGMWFVNTVVSCFTNLNLWLGEDGYTCVCVGKILSPDLEFVNRRKISPNTFVCALKCLQTGMLVNWGITLLLLGHEMLPHFNGFIYYKIFNLMEFYLSVAVLVCAFGILSKKLLLRSMSWRFPHSFAVSGPTLKSFYVLN